MTAYEIEIEIERERQNGIEYVLLNDNFGFQAAAQFCADQCRMLEGSSHSGFDTEFVYLPATPSFY